MAISLRIRPSIAARLEGGEVPTAERGTSRPADRLTTEPDGDPGALRLGSLRFLDDQVERRYQRQGGAEGRTGFRITTGAAAVLWLLAALVVPTGTPIHPDRAIPLCLAMVVLNFAAFLLSARAATLDRQHLIISLLTSANGLVILWLASTGGVLPGYGISAIMLLFAFGFVARTGFIFAAWRSAVIVAGFAAAAILYPGRANLVVDAFIFGAAVIGTLLALRLLERSRRRVFYQDMVITRQRDALRREKEQGRRALVQRPSGIHRRRVSSPVSGRSPMNIRPSPCSLPTSSGSRR